MATTFPDHAGPLHPLHAMLAAYPLAFFTAALVTDIAYARSANVQWANFSVWLIAAGVAIGLVAAVAGIVDGLVTRRRRRASALHSAATAVTFVLAILNGFVHSRDGWTAVVPTGLVLSALTSILVLVTSWLGYRATARQGGR